MEFDKEEIEEAIKTKIDFGVSKYGKEFKFLILEIMSLKQMIYSGNEQEQKQARLIPLVKWNIYHSEPSINALRMIAFRAEENGFSDVIVRRGKRVLINEEKYFEWLNKKQNKRA